MKETKMPKTANYKCEYCGNDIYLPPHRLKSGEKHYCNRKCYTNGRKITEKTVKFNCDYCGKACERIISVYKLAKSHFCNKECVSKWLIRQSSIECICSFCGKTIHTQANRVNRNSNNFCNKECYVKWLPNTLKAHKNPSWKGGRVTTHEGYIRKYMPEHPNSNHQYILEHRFVMEKKLGRYLTKNEIVHHLNGIRDDNRPENLHVTIRGKHEKNTVIELYKNKIRALEYLVANIYGCPN